MSGYRYSDKQLQEWPEAPRAAALWERATNAEQNAAYWKNRAESAEHRMQNHECQEDD